MYEGDLMAAGADSGNCIDESVALGLQCVELSLNVFTSTAMWWIPEPFFSKI